MKLCDISDEQLEILITLTGKEEDVYISELISKHYPNIIIGSKEYEELKNAYISSFKLEYLYRTDFVFQSGFRAIYTKTGLIRNIINDLYYNDDDLITH